MGAEKVRKSLWLGRGFQALQALVWYAEEAPEGLSFSQCWAASCASCSPSAVEGEPASRGPILLLAGGKSVGLTSSQYTLTSWLPFNFSADATLEVVNEHSKN